MQEPRLKITYFPAVTAALFRLATLRDERVAAIEADVQYDDDTVIREINAEMVRITATAIPAHYEVEYFPLKGDK